MAQAIVAFYNRGNLHDDQVQFITMPLALSNNNQLGRGRGRAGMNLEVDARHLCVRLQVSLENHPYYNYRGGHTVKQPTTYRSILVSRQSYSVIR